MNAEAAARLLSGTPVALQAAVVGLLSALAAVWLTRRSLHGCDTEPGRAPVYWGICAGLLTAGLLLATLKGGCQEIPEVRPSALWWHLRPVYHALLIVLLIAATATDLRTYYILDAITLNGAVLAVLLATLSGDLQMCHLWVDWSQEIPQLRGPYIPGWLAEHPHWHGLAWSAAGLVAGAGVTWIARAVSSLVLGQEALGFGDVTLMGMIGAFIGWQAVLIVFLLAPLCAIAAGIVVRLCSSRTYVPYGPYLSLAAVVVLFGWRAIWMFEWQLSPAQAAGRGDAVTTFALRRLFGDATGLWILAGMVVGGLVVLLGGWRLYRSIPIRGARLEE